MEKQTSAPFYIIGISVRTTNENGQAMQDIPALWNKFMTGQLADKIPNKTSQAIYCIYTDYEKDHTRPYTTYLGCKVSSIDEIPAGLVAKKIEGGEFVKRTATGKPDEGAVYKEWQQIWNSDLPRAFTADFEVYDQRAFNPENAEVDIFIAVL